MKVLQSTIISFLISGFFGLAQGSKPYKEKFVIAPPENILLVVASQPNAPLLIEEAKLLLSLTPGEHPRFHYRLRSISKKPIRSYTVAAWFSDQTGGTIDHGESSIMLSGDIRAVNESGYEVVPLTDEIREKLGLKKGMQGIVVLMVQSITFADGSSYNAEPTSRALLQLFEDKFH